MICCRADRFLVTHDLQDLGSVCLVRSASDATLTLAHMFVGGICCIVRLLHNMPYQKILDLDYLDCDLSEIMILSRLRYVHCVKCLIITIYCGADRFNCYCCNIAS